MTATALALWGVHLGISIAIGLILFLVIQPLAIFMFSAIWTGEGMWSWAVIMLLLLIVLPALIGWIVYLLGYGALNAVATGLIIAIVFFMIGMFGAMGGG